MLKAQVIAIDKFYRNTRYRNSGYDTQKYNKNYHSGKT